MRKYFRNISIMGRVIYIIYSLECYLRINDDLQKWHILFDALWSYPQYEHAIDDYAYKVIECMPECVLDEREDFTDFEYFNEAQLDELKELYLHSPHTEVIENLMKQINEILSYNLYTTVYPPENYSLNVISTTYHYIKKLLNENTPALDDFKIYSIYENDCWGDFTGKFR